MDASSISGLYPEGEMNQPPLATPLSGPKLVLSSAEIKRGVDSPYSVNDFYPSTAVHRRRHESYLLSGSVFLIAGNGQKVKLPAPSDSPADPLSWGRWKRAGVFMTVSWFTIVALAVVQAASLFMREMSREFDVDTTTAITIPGFFMAMGSFVWIPLTIGMGRRPVFLLASLLMLFATLGTGYSQNFPQLLACMCFLSLGEAFALTASLLIMIDMTYIDERPKAIAILWSIAGLFGTGCVAIAPHISHRGTEWRAYYRYWSILATVSFVLAFFLFPETYFKRPTVAFDGLIVLQSATEKLTVFKDIEADSEIYRDLPKLPTPAGILGQFNVWRSPFASWISMGRCYLQIAFCLINPLVFWMSIALSINYSGMMFIGTSYPRILREEPYRLSSEGITLVNLASALGGLVAYPIGVFPVQKVLDRLARRNRGVREAEHYLVGLILPVLTGAASTLIYGFAVQYGLHISAYYCAYGLNGFSWVTIAITTTMWVTEAFPRWAAPALAALSGVGFLITFGMTYALTPWTEAHGFQLVGIEFAVLQLISGLVAVPIAFWGKSARQAIHGRWADERGGALRPL